MADAGRIGFVLKGEYDNEFPYECLDVVTYNNVLYSAKRDTKGNPPIGDDDENWKVLIKNFVSGDFASREEIPTLVKVDGDTITKDADGTLHGTAEITVDTELSETSQNPVANATVAKEIKEHTHDERYYKKEIVNEKLNEINRDLGGLKFGVTEQGILTVTYDDGL